MMEKINYKELSFDSYDATYKNLIKLSDENILNILNEMRDFEDNNKGYDFESLILLFTDHKNNEIRLFCTKYMEKSSDFSLIRKLRKIINNEAEKEIRFHAINIFGNWIKEISTKKNRMNEIGRLMNFGIDFIKNSDDKSEQNNMMKSVSHLSNEEIDKIIMEKFSSKELEDKLSAIISMGNNGNIKWVPLIEELLDHDNYQIRSESCISLSLIGNEENIDQIKELLEDEELDTQKAAVNAISNIGGSYAKEILEKLKFSSEPEIVDLSKDKLLDLKKEDEIDSQPQPDEDILEDEPISNDFDEYYAANIEGWGSLNEDGTSFIAPDAIDDDIDDPIKSLSDYEKPIEQPDIDD